MVAASALWTEQDALEAEDGLLGPRHRLDQLDRQDRRSSQEVPQALKAASELQFTNT